MSDLEMRRRMFSAFTRRKDVSPVGTYYNAIQTFLSARHHDSGLHRMVP